MHLFRRKSSATSTSRMSQPRILIRSLRTKSQTPDKLDPKPVKSNESYSFTPDCLKVHSITQGFRARMVDWMCEIVSVFQLSPKTFFLSVKIMDKYFMMQSVSIHSSLLHIIGIVCLFIGSKFEDVQSLSMKSVHDKIGHSKFTIDDLCITEQAILKKLGFLVNFFTRIDFVEELCDDLKIPLSVRKTALFFSTLSLYFYTHLEYKESEVACASIYLAARVLKNENVAQRIKSKSVEFNSFVCFEKFYEEIAEFHRNFPSLKSAFKTYRVSFEVRNGQIELVNLS